MPLLEFADVIPQVNSYHIMRHQTNVNNLITICWVMSEILPTSQEISFEANPNLYTIWGGYSWSWYSHWLDIFCIMYSEHSLRHMALFCPNMFIKINSLTIHSTQFVFPAQNPQMSSCDTLSLGSSVTEKLHCLFQGNSRPPCSVYCGRQE